MATVTRENIGLLNDKLVVTVTKDEYFPSFEKNLKNYDLSLLKYRTTKNQTQPNCNTLLIALQLKKKVLEYEEQLIKEQLKETNSLLTKDKKTK